MAAIDSAWRKSEDAAPPSIPAPRGRAETMKFLASSVSTMDLGALETKQYDDGLQPRELTKLEREGKVTRSFAAIFTIYK
jgi:hypothetical protein